MNGWWVLHGLDILATGPIDMGTICLDDRMKGNLKHRISWKACLTGLRDGKDRRISSLLFEVAIYLGPKKADRFA
jgi:hypothetical protein